MEFDLNCEICALSLECLEITKEIGKEERKGTERKEIQWIRQKNGD